jgi:hypothetical protein
VANTVSVISATPHPDQADTASTATFRIRGNSAIRLIKTATPSTVRARGAVVYDIVIENLGGVRGHHHQPD